MAPCSGGQGEIRTRGTSRFAGFRNRCIRPLCHLSMRCGLLLARVEGVEPPRTVLETAALTTELHPYGNCKAVSGGELSPAVAFRPTIGKR